MTSRNEERTTYLAKVASMYYDQGKSQQEIARELSVSRSAISRFLTEAKERGIVEIIVHYPWRTVPALEATLVSTFHLKAARVLERHNKTYKEMLRGLGILASQYLNDILTDGMAIGISWGTALYQMIRAMPPMNLSSVEIIQLIGATGSENIPTDGPILAQLLANRLGGYCRYLHAPLIVDTAAAREVLMKNQGIRKALERAEHADIALVGIGTTQPELYSLLRAGYVSKEEAQRIRASGAVGDICAQHYALNGEWLDIDINRRAVGISLDTLTAIDTVIGVAGGSQKGSAILGALRGHYVDVLITDDQAAQKVLALQHATGAR